MNPSNTMTDTQTAAPIDYEALEERLGVTFADRTILREAMTHRSYLNENTSCTWNHNERLEFLGDAVLELVVTDYLFREFPEKAEGELTSYRAALVSSPSLSEAASDINVGEHLLLSKGEAKDTGKARQYILANTFEAVIGAIYLDQKYEVAADFISRALFPKLDTILEKGLWRDAKSTFQEKAQEKVSITPSYEVLEEVGPDHDKEFTIGVYLSDELAAKGYGKSKQEAEQDAARNALNARGW